MPTLLVTGTLAVVVAVTGAAATVAAEQRQPAPASSSGERQDDGLEEAEDKAGEKAERQSERQSAKEAEKAERRAAHEAFVAAKQSWSDCVTEAAPAADGVFDPEAACGSKPRNPQAATGHGSTRDGTGPPPWSGGPGQRSQEPPGQVKKDA